MTGGGAPPALRAAGRALELRAPLLMGIVNTSPDSFSDGPGQAPPARRGGALVAAGAAIVDVGWESGITNRPPVAAQEEIARVVPVIEALTGPAGPGVPVSVDTYKPEVAAAAVAAGASIVNDVSGLLHPALADVCAATGAALVITHTRTAPKTKRLEPGFYGAGVAADVAAFLEQRMALAVSRGVAEDHIMLDPGPDFAKTPAQTVAALQGLDRVLALGRPVLLALSRKDFIGAITGRGPRERLAGTLAALAWGVEAGGHVFRLHDVAEAADFLAVRAVLRGDASLDPGAMLDEGLRRV